MSGPRRRGILRTGLVLQGPYPWGKRVTELLDQPLAMPSRNDDAAEEALEAGLRAEHADDFQRALHLYADAAIRGAGVAAIVARSLVRQAGVYRRLSEWDVAADYARRARELADGAGLPELHAEALVAQGNALMCSGRLEEASVVYQRLVRVAMNDRQRGI